MQCIQVAVGHALPCAPWKVVPERPSEPATQRRPVRVMVQDEVAVVYPLDQRVTLHQYGLYDLYGRLLHAGTVTAADGAYWVPLADLPAGIYLLTLPEIGFYGRLVKVQP